MEDARLLDAGLLDAGLISQVRSSWRVWEISDLALTASEVVSFSRFYVPHGCFCFCCVRLCSGSWYAYACSWWPVHTFCTHVLYTHTVHTRCDSEQTNRGTPSLDHPGQPIVFCSPTSQFFKGFLGLLLVPATRPCRRQWLILPAGFPGATAYVTGHCSGTLCLNDRDERDMFFWSTNRQEPPWCYAPSAVSLVILCCSVLGRWP